VENGQKSTNLPVEDDDPKDQGTEKGGTDDLKKTREKGEGIKRKSVKVSGKKN